MPARPTLHGSALAIRLGMIWLCATASSGLHAIKPPSLAQGREHWAFLPLQKPMLPQVRQQGWARNAVDHFVLAELEAKALAPAAQADAATLVRRLHWDLIGLPPSPQEVERFARLCEDPQHAERAYAELVDRLLQSPHYGERWGRHWLDLARYADSGGVHNDLDRPQAYKYRDYVIASFNEDKRYARFMAEQLAGDEVQGANPQSLIATGFCRNGQSNDDNMGKTAEALEQYRVDQLDDVISTAGSVFLGLSIGCARCHDHKTEPLLQRDYYSLLAVFNGTQKLGLGKGAKDANDKTIKDGSKVMALVETSPVVPATHVLARGNAAARGELVLPAVPQVLGGHSLMPDRAGEKTSRRRLMLVQWIGSPDNALFWRVIVNRVWQHHFGHGIVATPSDFGFTGARPSHPQLLDWLAAWLINNDGRLKGLHRLLVMSATYRQQRGSQGTGALAPSPLRFANLQRLEAEAIRDGILVASGNLNALMGGPGIKPRIRADLLDASQRNRWPVLNKEGPEHWRRSVYVYLKRQLLLPSLELLDAPTTTDSCALRTQSTVPTQALLMMNDEFVQDQAQALAARAMAEVGPQPSDGIHRCFELILGRRPTAAQLAQALEFVGQRSAAGNASEALADLAHVLFNSSEFFHIP